MKKRVRILGKKALPIWLLVIALVACGAGAAAGTILAGKVTGEVPVAVSQALLVCEPSWGETGDVEDTVNQDAPQQLYKHLDWIHEPNRHIGVVADDMTGFQAAAELAIGDWAAFRLPIKNASQNDLVAELCLSVPECIEVEIFSDTDVVANNIGNPVRIGLNCWKLVVEAEADCLTDLDNDYLWVVVSVDDHCMPGYYTISGTIKQISY